MPTYRYAAVLENGKEESGSVSAEDVAHARLQLVGRGLQVREVRPRKKFTEIQMTKKKVKPEEIANLSRQLGAFLRAGIPILDAFESIGEETKDPIMKAMLPEITSQLRNGDPLSEAIAVHALHFPNYYPGIIRSAELSGNLAVVLDQLADYIERDIATSRKVKSALTYPLILAAMSTVTVVVLVGFVLPKFKDFFIGFGATLPLTTRMLLGLGDFVQKSGLTVAAVFFVTVIALVAFGKTERGKLTKNKMALRTPIVKTVVQAAVIERFCRILSAMVQAGIPISASMTAAIDSTDNRIYSAKLREASTAMLEGRGFAVPIAETGIFPGMVTQMMRVGEETGTLDRQLEVAADYYERQLSYKLERLTAAFEPLVIVVMGLVVGFVAVALVQAMYGVYSQSGAGG